MRRHTIVHAVIVGILFLVCLDGIGPSSGLALAQDKDNPRPNYPAGFAPGVRVTLLEDAPTVGLGLEAGMSGTIVCCQEGDCTGSILVAWDLQSPSGVDVERACSTVPFAIYPAGLAQVNPSEVKLGLPFDKTGMLQEDPEGCLYLAADEGGVFYLVLAPEFRKQWWVINSGSHVRVRGLLNKSPVDSKTDRSCPQADGDVYHPILSLDEWWPIPCVDRWVCGFDYGDRVVLVSESNPYGAVDLPRGATGTIICGKWEGEQLILVSWDLWTHGGDPRDYTQCGDRLNGLFPPGSTWWVNAKDLAKVFESDCGVLQKISLCVGDECLDPDAVGLFAGSDAIYYLPGVAPDPQISDVRVRVLGLFTPYGKLLNGRIEASDTAVRQDLTGMILESVVVPCVEPSCCQPAYRRGERVELLVDEPGGAKGLMAGASGKVVCCNSADPVAPIFVTWDNWANGDDHDEACDERPGFYYRDDSAWWVACSEIRRLVLADLYDVPEGFHGVLPTTLVAGKAGQALKVSGDIGNRGAIKSEYFMVYIYASADGEITSQDYLLGQVGMVLDPGASMGLSWMGNFPTSIPAGTYFIGWVIDPDNRVKEENETNNTGIIDSMPLTVTAE
jgi:hypothetical protein